MTRRFRIAMVAACPFPAPRGTPVRIYRIAEALTRRGHAVDVFTYHLAYYQGAHAPQAAFSIHRIPQIKTYRKQSPGPSYQKLLLLDPLLAVKLVRALGRGNYDVLHAHHAEGLLAALPAHWLHRVPLVFDVHTLLETELPYYRMGLSRALLRRVGRALDAWLPGRADRIIAVSEQIRAAIVDRFGYPAQALSIIPNGVEEEFSAAVTPLASSLLGRGVTVVYAGTLAAFQRIDLLLQGFAAALAQRPDLRLQIYSDSSFAEFEALAVRLGVREHIAIQQLRVEDLPARLAATDVALNPRTDCSGTPQKLVNYMAAGCPIVSFAGSAKHLVHGQTGWVVPDGDIDAFAAGILRLIDDRPLARQLGAAAQEFARRELGWTRVAERIEAVYEQVAGCRQPR